MPAPGRLSRELNGFYESLIPLLALGSWLLANPLLGEPEAKSQEPKAESASYPARSRTAALASSLASALLSRGTCEMEKLNARASLRQVQCRE